jgi:type II secretory pathway pseudopilin PulG
LHKKITLHKKRGVESIPFELLVIVIILAIVLPLLYNLFIFYKQQQQIQQLSGQINVIGATVIEVFNGGLNTSIVLSVTLPKDTQKVIIGSNNPSSIDSDLIVYQIYNHAYYYKVNNGATDIPMTNTTSNGYSPFTFGSSIVIILTKMVSKNGIVYVNVGTYKT